MSSLDVWRDGRLVATVAVTRRRMQLTYTADAGQAGSPVVSVAMPVASVPYGDKVVRPYFRGLLPEGEARTMIAYDLGLDAADDVGLLAALGRDCAGALIVVPAGERPPAPVPGNPDVLDDVEIERRLRNLPVFPLGVTGAIRASLPGVQPKLVLTHDGTRWLSPDPARPSTHILKPAIPELVDSIANEEFCMLLAAHAGLPAATTTVATFGSTPVLISHRYDRYLDVDGTVRRLHQEDTCQALSILTPTAKHKYEAFGGPSLRRIAALLDNWGGDPRELLRYVTFNVIVGNADLHGKNVSLLHDRDGTIGLAPLYDVMCTTYYDGHGDRRLVDTEPGLFVAGRRDITTIDATDLVDEAESWHIRRSTAQAVVDEIIDAVDAAIPAAVAASSAAPAGVVNHVQKRLSHLRGRQSGSSSTSGQRPDRE